MDYLMKLVTTALEWTRSGLERPTCEQKRWRRPLHSLCFAVIRFGSLTEQDQA